MTAGMLRDGNLYIILFVCLFFCPSVRLSVCQSVPTGVKIVVTLVTYLQ